VQKITLLFTFLITLALSAVIIIFFQGEKLVAKAPKELYKVYLAGDEIGVIKSKAKLEEYIDKKQEEIKKKYNVDTVYPPNNLNIQKYISYGDKVLTEEEVYNKISKVSPFTVKGYVFKIKATTEGEQDKVINVLNKDLFKNASTKVIEAFIPKEDYQLYLDDKQPEIKDTGKIIENIDYSDITEKESFISSTDKIFTDEKELAKYLLFSTTEEQEKYTVKDGDTIEQISFSHKLGTEEFMVVNPEFTNANSLLFPGQEVSVGLIKPLINVTVMEQIVEDQVIPYDTETITDNTVAYGTTQIKQEGAEGLQRVVEKRQTTNGVISDVRIDRGATQVLKDPVKKIIVKGTKSDNGPVTISPDGKWVWPTNIPYVITTYFGYRWGELHAAIDIAGCGYGSPIRAARAGTVYKSGYDKTKGNYIILAHDNNYYTNYLHMSKKYITEGQTVAAGQIIGAMGNSGFVVGTTGTHLHFGAFIGEPYKSTTRNVNPLTLYR
jgi:murein DD-endopeptidase MepM/ murein hydrolase activator NlpD